MHLKEFKSTWNTIETPVFSSEEIYKMLSENNHPVIRRIRTQLTIEIIVWSIFLICYYSVFDGERKPVWINILLICSVLIPLGYNFMGYRISKYLIQGSNIRESLMNYIAKVRVFAVISIVSRQVYLMGILLFFTYGLKFNSERYMPLIVIGLIFIFQLWISCRIWNKRIENIRNAITSLSD